MHRPLERQMVVGPHGWESRDRPIHGLEVGEVQRVRQSTQYPTEFGAVPRLPRLHTRSRSPLNLRQLEVVRYVANRINAHVLKLLNRTGVDSRQIADVVVRTRRIAMVIELACDGIGALVSRRDVGSLRHGKNGELRT